MSENNNDIEHINSNHNESNPSENKPKLELMDIADCLDAIDLDLVDENTDEYTVEKHTEKGDLFVGIRGEDLRNFMKWSKNIK